MRTIRLISTFLALAVVRLETVQNRAGSFPPTLESYLMSVVKLTAEERKRLTDGEAVTRMLDADASKEVAVLGAVWINVPVHRYVEAVKDIETFERGGGFKMTKRISTPPRREDFAELRLPDDDIEDLRTCRLSDCEIKIGEQALQRFRTEVDWKQTDARAATNAVMQQLLFEYVTGYLAGGNERLAVYRDTARPTFVAREFRSMIDQMPELTTYMPAVRRYLLEYPKATVPASTSLLYWQVTEFGLKPTIRMSHLTIHERANDAVVVSKMLYASHYFWTALELRGLLSDPSRGQGFWFVTVNRSRSDGLSGFSGQLVGRRVRSEVEDGVRAALQSTRRRLEAGSQ